MNLSQRLAHTTMSMCCTALMLTLAACGGGNPSEAASATTPSSTETQAQTFKASDYFAANVGDQRIYENMGLGGTTVETFTTQQAAAGSTSFGLERTDLEGAHKRPQYVTLDQGGYGYQMRHWIRPLTRML